MRGEGWTRRRTGSRVRAPPSRQNPWRSPHAPLEPRPRRTACRQPRTGHLETRRRLLSRAFRRYPRAVHRQRDRARAAVSAEFRQGLGWLPVDREAARGRQTGRTQEIQRLIGRSLRAVTRLEAFGERQITVDCDVIQADGGTRTAAITGAWVALHQAFAHMQRVGAIEAIPLSDQVAAVSCGLWQGTPVLDLDYAEDSMAEADANFVFTGSGGIVEIQGTAEAEPFSREQLDAMIELARQGIAMLTSLQRQALGL